MGPVITTVAVAVPGLQLLASVLPPQFSAGPSLEGAEYRYEVSQATCWIPPRLHLQRLPGLAGGQAGRAHHQEGRRREGRQVPLVTRLQICRKETTRKMSSTEIINEGLPSYGQASNYESLLPPRYTEIVNEGIHSYVQTSYCVKSNT